MRPLLFCVVAALSCGALACASGESAAKPSSATLRKDVNEEMQLINKSLEGLLSELATIKREATGRLSQVKSKLASANSKEQQERIRQTKVSRFVLKRVAELELESLGMRDEMVKLFELEHKSAPSEQQVGGRSRAAPASGKQEDVADFDETSAPSSRAPATSTTSTAKPNEQQQQQQEEEAAKIGFDLEQLKRLGNELESEIEARQAQGAESVRGVHEQVIKLVDNMVQNQLANMRNTLQRITNFIDNRRRPAAAGLEAAAAAAAAAPSEAPSEAAVGAPAAERELVKSGEDIVDGLQTMTRRFNEFSSQWSKTLARQQSPLIDRIPPRGVELWRDFWDTMRKQVRRINEEFLQMSRDMSRLITGRPASSGSRVIVRPGRAGDQSAPALSELLYAASSSLSAQTGPLSREQSQEQIKQQFQDFYDKLTLQLAREQLKMNELSKTSSSGQQQQQQKNQQQGEQQLFDELDDEATRQELANNVALRQQIQQEINVFGSIFDIMRTFIARLRDSATTIRDILTPPGAIFDNNPVTPGPAVKPTVDQLLENTINSQRNINSQAKPPTSRD